MKIIQITDCHLFADPEKAAYQYIKPYYSLQRVLADAVKQRPELVVFSGDISGDDSAQSYQLFLQLLEQFKLLGRTKVIAGNHDNNPFFDSYLASFNLAESAPICTDNWAIHGMDTRHQGTSGWLDKDRLLQVHDNMQRTAVPYHMLFCHHHPINTNSWMDKHAWLNREEFIDWVSHNPQVKLVLYGHIHQQTSHRIGQCQLLGCPSSCWQFANSRAFSLAELAPGYRVVELCADGLFSSNIIRINKDRTTP